MLNINKCHICKIPTKFPQSKIAKKIFNNAISKCKICPNFSGPEDKIKLHYKNNHLKKNKNIQRILNDQDIFQIFLKIFNIKKQRKFLIHSHPLKVSIGPLVEYKGNSFYQNPDCKFKNPEEIFFLEENIILRFFSRIFYNCEICDFKICFFCKDMKEISFMSFLHEHPLDLNLFDEDLNDYDNNIEGNLNNNNEGKWICDNDNCLMGINSVGKSKGVTRFSCLYCDFYLCEKCLEGNLMK